MMLQGYSTYYSFALLAWLASNSCHFSSVSAQRYRRPEWWKRIKQQDTSGLLRTCKTKVKQGLIPSDGDRCRRDKICYFDTQDCGEDSVGAHPETRCECSNREWACASVSCPPSIVTLPIEECQKMNSCQECMENPQCGSWYPGFGDNSGSCYPGCMIADVPCYSGDASSADETCQRVLNDQADAALCSSIDSEDNGACGTCTSTTLSDGVSTCKWFDESRTNSESSYCASSCNMLDGCGDDLCAIIIDPPPLPLPVCEGVDSCSACLENPDCGSWYPQGVGGAGSCYNGCMIADILCYQAEEPSEVDATCQRAIDDQADQKLCGSIESGCTDCVQTTKSDGSSCLWISNEPFVGICASNDGLVGPGTTVCPVVMEPNCEAIDTCSACLDNPECGHFYPHSDGTGSCFASCMIADTECYTPSSFEEGLTTDEICREVANDVADEQLCISLTDSGCGECTSTITSDGTSMCRWFSPEAWRGGPDDGFCGFKPGMLGEGSTECPVSCQSLTTCEECLSEPTCGHFYSGGSCFEWCMIADIPCYSPRTFPGLTVAESCQEVANDVADQQLCSSVTSDEGCDACVGTVMSDGTSACQWVSTEQFTGEPGGFCASTCTMMGCGTTTCPINDGSCGSQSDCSEGELCYAPDDQMCGTCQQFPPSCSSDEDCPAGGLDTDVIGVNLDATVCDTRKHICLCNGNGPTCNPACTSDEDCKLGDTCLDDGHCTPTACVDDDECVDNFACSSGRCSRRTCSAIADCSVDGGSCVNGRCYPELGFCSIPVA